MLVDLKALRTELLAINAEATTLCEGLSGDQLGWRPDRAKWSIAEHLTHLCKTTHVFLPTVDSAIGETRRRGSREAGPFCLGWYGRLLVWCVEPPPKVRLPAPRVLRPQRVESPERALENFLMMQGAVMRRMEDADGLDLRRLRFPLPLASYIRVNLLEFFSIFNVHCRRHLWHVAKLRRNILAADGAVSRSAT